MQGQERISALLTRLHAGSPAGFAIALHIRFTAPRYLFQSYAKDWIDTYSRDGLVLQDPAVRWGFVNDGAIRWSALEDPAGVLDRAAGHGLRFGAAIAFMRGGTRTMGGFARSDRELTDGEIAGLKATLEVLHDLTGTVEALAPEVHQKLKRMAIVLIHG